MDAPGPAPEDFAAFVATHSDRIRTAGQALTGNDRLVEALQRDMFAAVALRWWWLRRQPMRRRARAAAGHLDRVLHREARNWRADVDGVPRSGVAYGRPEPHPGREAGELADVAWGQATRTRNRRRMVVVVAIAAIGSLVVVAPRRSPALPTSVEPTPPLPTTVPAGVRVMPPFADLGSLPRRQTRLPDIIRVDAGSAIPLSVAPVPRAVAMVQQDLGPLIVVAEDGATRYVNDAALAGARMLTTSLSPDGTRAALTTSDGLLVVDVPKGTIHLVRSASMAQPAAPALTWRSPRAVLVPTGSGAQEINVDTGAVSHLAGVSGLNVVTTQGPAVGRIAEMLATGAQGDTFARIRLWRTPPRASTIPSPSTAATAVGTPAASTIDAEDRAVSGPPWITRWHGPGWSTLDTYARSCNPADLLLPPSVGVARDAVCAISGTGAAVATIAVVDGTTLEPLGFLDLDTVLVSTGGPQYGALVLAWNVRTGELRTASVLSAFARICLPDLLV